jgi:stearoyl-CoA desaturase (delta-9 desaturase)
MISVCSKLGLASNLNRVPDFRIQRALLDAEFERARTKLEQAQNSESLLAMLEREYQEFTESINQWTSLQAERYGRKREQLGGALEEKKAHLQHKWETAALRTRLKELEYSLKMQRKRVGLLVQQLQLQGHVQAV